MLTTTCARAALSWRRSTRQELRAVVERVLPFHELAAAHGLDQARLDEERRAVLALSAELERRRRARDEQRRRAERDHRAAVHGMLGCAWTCLRQGREAPDDEPEERGDESRHAASPGSDIGDKAGCDEQASDEKRSTIDGHAESDKRDVGCCLNAGIIREAVVHSTGSRRRRQRGCY